MLKKISAIFVFLLPVLLAGCASVTEQVWIPGWKQTSPLTIARAGAAVVVANDFIYMIAGVDGKDFTNTTEYAKIEEDGSLGPWQQGSKLHEARGFIEAVVHNGFIYVVGGGNGAYGHNLLKSVERARILPNGALGPWLKQADMQVARRCSKATATDKKIYSFGGYSGVMLDTVESAEFRPDGSLGEWQLEPEIMVEPRYINSIKQVNDRIYAIGGHEQVRGVGVGTVEWSQINTEGVLQKWRATTPMKAGRYGHSTFSHNNYIYALGGLSGAEYLDTVEKTEVVANGELASWQATTSLSLPRSNFSTAYHNNYIYVLGGSNNDGYPKNVEYATLNAQGDIGFWGAADEALAYREEMSKIQERRANLPNSGVAQVVIQTEGYTYLQVRKTNGSLEWVAGPKVNLPVNSSVRYSTGVAMPNFYSKELKRNFPMVLFVGQVQKVD